jgi:hypothetical protein
MRIFHYIKKKFLSMNSLKIWQKNVLSSGNLITVYSNGTYSTSTTTDETAAN